MVHPYRLALGLKKPSCSVPYSDSSLLRVPRTSCCFFPSFPFWPDTVGTAYIDVLMKSYAEHLQMEASLSREATCGRGQYRCHSLTAACRHDAWRDSSRSARSCRQFNGGAAVTGIFEETTAVNHVQDHTPDVTLLCIKSPERTAASSHSFPVVSNSFLIPGLSPAPFATVFSLVVALSEACLQTRDFAVTLGRRAKTQYNPG